ncbi:uncharacterized protein LOC106071684 [Biomphalaria glabrata]|uniref:Uncharacterized protein LOC106071684 n=1 Tax=Biomphalaria glabrata TaxID=6526 RepID=A0A9U8EGY1_BIOGL|nr:uncharacterized protein LOC106071684 [Biomphalaria glabrata]KAI8772199.1 hypothetical protein BgiBS90_026679 [Biomphalaria glabrata]
MNCVTACLFAAFIMTCLCMTSATSSPDWFIDQGIDDNGGDFDITETVFPQKTTMGDDVETPTFTRNRKQMAHMKITSDIYNDRLRGGSEPSVKKINPRFLRGRGGVRVAQA